MKVRKIDDKGLYYWVDEEEQKVEEPEVKVEEPVKEIKPKKSFKKSKK